MNVYRSRFQPLVVIGMLLALSGLVASPTGANAQNPGNPAILNALQGIQSQLNDIQDQIAGLTPPAVTTLTTSPLRAAAGESLGCNVLNAGDTPVTVSSQILDVSAQRVCPPQGFPNPEVTLASGTGSTLGCGVAGATGYCRVTVSSGPASAIRAVLCVGDNTGSCKASSEAR